MISGRQWLSVIDWSNPKGSSVFVLRTVQEWASLSCTNYAAKNIKYWGTLKNNFLRKESAIRGEGTGSHKESAGN